MNTQQEFEKDGRRWHRGCLKKSSVEQLRREINIIKKPGERLNPDQFASIENYLRPVIMTAQKLYPNCRPVGAIIFNKTKETNWSVGWHQDRTISVAEKHVQSGYKNWTKKRGSWYCEPPIEILESMIFARIHLDAASEANGCLEVAVGTHNYGSMASDEIAHRVKRSKTENCIASSGDVLFGKALLLHRSKPTTSDASRMALRIDFANVELPDPLKWAYTAARGRINFETIARNAR